MSGVPVTRRIVDTELRHEIQASLRGAYTLERGLTGGRMSRVFVARDEQLRRDVVVKVLDPELARTVSAERFTQEIRLVQIAARGVDERDMLLAENLFDPVLDPLRHSSRYRELLARMEIGA